MQGMAGEQGQADAWSDLAHLLQAGSVTSNPQYVLEKEIASVSYNITTDEGPGSDSLKRVSEH